MRRSLRAYHTQSSAQTDNGSRRVTCEDECMSTTWTPSRFVDGSMSVVCSCRTQHHCALPTFEVPISTLVFDPSRPHTLITVLINNTFKVFDVETRQFPVWARAVCEAVPRELLHKRDAVQGASFSPKAAPGAERPGLFLWGRDWLCYVELDGPVPPPAPAHAKKRRRSTVVDKRAGKGGAADEDDDDEPRENGDGSRPRRNYIVDSKYRAMLHLGFLGDGDLVVVERPFADVLATLPPAYYKQRYGAS